MVTRILCAIALLPLVGCLPWQAEASLKELGVFERRSDQLVADHEFQGENSYVQFAIEYRPPSGRPVEAGDSPAWPATVEVKVINDQAATIAEGTLETYELHLASLGSRKLRTFGFGARGRLEEGKTYLASVSFAEPAISGQPVYSLHLLHYRSLTQLEKWVDKLGLDA